MALYVKTGEGLFPAATVPGPPGPGFTQPSQTDRTPVTHTLGASPFDYTVPTGKVVSLSVTGGAGIVISVNPGGGMSTWIGGTGTQVTAWPGEVIRVAWTTVPTAVRTRVVQVVV